MNILIVDDHPLTCQGLAALLGAAAAGDSTPRHVHSVHDTAQARRHLAHMPVTDWVFLDINLPDDPTRSFFHELCASDWAARTVLISAEVPHGLVRQALGAGMRGFIPKSAEPDVVLAGFEAVRRGQVYLPPTLAALMHGAPPEPQPGRSLSPRLREVLGLVLRGASNKVIARHFGLSEYTIKEYMSSILAYHGVANRLELVLKLKGDDAR